MKFWKKKTPGFTNIYKEQFYEFHIIAVLKKDAQ